ncbi:hypothetical protein L0663_05260 [Dyadobacter sp. CY107]|uniref:hypothetical protein n=1 Tax=Dyadobacter fanqingshengii TaxID=2906443 RepID=UPI001F2BF141|nr:hypothetical protein [Dyadobacter fanqingshengii]MCF2502776.1 hypothetical protein [Dyadobacter fanqingshengii]
MYAILNYIAATIVGLSLGYAVGHWIGKGEGEKLAIAENNMQVTAEAAKSGNHREKIDHEINKLPDTAIDAELSANGWMRR